MTSTTPTNLQPSFQKALDDFKSDLTQDEQIDIGYTTLPELLKCMRSIQIIHARKSTNMNRVSCFLEAMNEYSKVIEVFLNTSAILCFVWVLSRQARVQMVFTDIIRAQ